jgi:hypothetical protein
MEGKTLGAAPMSSVYNASSSLQLGANLEFISELDEAFQHASSEPTPLISVVDYGCSGGKNSMIAFGSSIEKFRKTCDKPISIYHVDLTSNHWSQVFDVIRSNRFSYLKQSKVYMFATGGDFYTQLFPEESIDIGYSCMSIHWLSEELVIPDHYYPYSSADPAVLQKAKEIAGRDLSRFLEHRKKELRTGGWMLLHSGTDGEGLIEFKEPLNLALKDLVDSEVMTLREYQRFTNSAYFRTEEDWRTALAQFPDLRLVKLRRARYYHPSWQQFLQDSNEELAADGYTRYVKGWSENLIVRCLDRNRTDADRASIVEQVYGKLFEKNKANIRPFVMHSLYLVIEKVAVA